MRGSRLLIIVFHYTFISCKTLATNQPTHVQVSLRAFFGRRRKIFHRISDSDCVECPVPIDVLFIWIRLFIFIFGWLFECLIAEKPGNFSYDPTEGENTKKQTKTQITWQWELSQAEERKKLSKRIKVMRGMKIGDAEK